ncbi:unnamed protein product [Vitrella brassicaformis CCMP3155]|uniref:Uncharacterized protein n=1 Tax=Vitrella brassicaformis (strain CCMP3155) TaxID=1169540 RepID=A0A0G4GID7_VITBC|nr:unnamed protein product [Vitrella brassicaformis CCMP3155]|eukprot:CEM29594.1 unnamed protein product [Vitrella brassicaformis CCMP3155]
MSGSRDLSTADCTPERTLVHRHGGPTGHLSQQTHAGPLAQSLSSSRDPSPGAAAQDQGCAPLSEHLTPEEDAMLASLMQTHTERCKWVEIAKHMPGRVAKQCRDRWVNQINPTVSLYEQRGFDMSDLASSGAPLRLYAPRASTNRKKKRSAECDEDGSSANKQKIYHVLRPHIHENMATLHMSDQSRHPQQPAMPIPAEGADTGGGRRSSGALPSGSSRYLCYDPLLDTLCGIDTFSSDILTPTHCGKQGREPTDRSGLAIDRGSSHECMDAAQLVLATPLTDGLMRFMAQQMIESCRPTSSCATVEWREEGNRRMFVMRIAGRDTGIVEVTSPTKPFLEMAFLSATHWADVLARPLSNEGEPSPSSLPDTDRRAPLPSTHKDAARRRAASDETMRQICSGRADDHSLKSQRATGEIRDSQVISGSSAVGRQLWRTASVFSPPSTAPPCRTQTTHSVRSVVAPFADMMAARPRPRLGRKGRKVTGAQAEKACMVVAICPSAFSSHTKRPGRPMRMRAWRPWKRKSRAWRRRTTTTPETWRRPGCR